MEIVPQLFYPLLASAITIVVGVVALLLVSKFAKNFLKPTKVAVGVITVCSLIVVFAFMGTYYTSDVVPSGWYPSADTTGMLVSLAVLLIVLGVFYFTSKPMEGNDTKAIVFGAISVAMAFALSYARLFRLPQGGSVTFASLLPLMVYCAMFGTRRGVIVCFVYGTMQAIQDPFIIHPVQFLLDYSVAFSFIGISGYFLEKGLFKSKPIIGFVIGGILAVAFRYASHVLSGVFAFADYIGDGYTVLAWSFSYNAFSLVDMAISLAAGCFLFASPAFRRQLVSSTQGRVSL